MTLTGSWTLVRGKVQHTGTGVAVLGMMKPRVLEDEPMLIQCYCIMVKEETLFIVDSRVMVDAPRGPRQLAGTISKLAVGVSR